MNLFFDSRYFYGPRTKDTPQQTHGFTCSKKATAPVDKFPLFGDNFHRYSQTGSVSVVVLNCNFVLIYRRSIGLCLYRNLICLQRSIPLFVFTVSFDGLTYRRRCGIRTIKFSPCLGRTFFFSLSAQLCVSAAQYSRRLTIFICVDGTQTDATKRIRVRL